MKKFAAASVAIMLLLIGNVMVYGTLHAPCPINLLFAAGGFGVLGLFSLAIAEMKKLGI